MNYLISRCMFKPPSPTYDVNTFDSNPEIKLVRVQTMGVHTKKLHTTFGVRAQCVQSPKCVLLYCHGNMEDCGQLVKWFKYISTTYNAIVYGVEYTGYGITYGSHTPSMNDAYDDVIAMFMHVGQSESLPYYVWARSMGCAPASHAIGLDASSCKGLLLESPFCSPLAVAFHMHMFFETKFENIEEIERLTLPILVIHGTDDKTVPFWHGETLYKKYKDMNQAPAYLCVVKGGKHNDLHSTQFKNQMFSTISKFLRDPYKNPIEKQYMA